MGRRVAGLGTVPAASIVLLFVLSGVLAVMRPRPTPPAIHPTQASVTLLRTLAVIAAYSTGTVTPAHRFAPVPHTPLLRGPRGLPRVVYVGAEFCPYCASERWAVIVALDRFGSFASLSLAWSAPDDLYPNTPTFTFHDAVYRSAYIDFTLVETRTNIKIHGQYAPLELPSAADTLLARTYDAPPYMPPYLAGAIPFIDIANQFVAAGGLDPRLLQGQSQVAIAARLSDPANPATRAILAGADEITAAVCIVTANAPASVCEDPAIRLAAHRLTAQAP